MEDEKRRMVISLSLPAWLVAKIRHQAFIRDISTSAYVKEILAKAITGGKDNGNS